MLIERRLRPVAVFFNAGAERGGVFGNGLPDPW
jgi:hypothetical protein